VSAVPVRVVTDSACDLPAEVAERLRIRIVPLSIRFADKEYVDREELDTDQFWDLCESSEELPSTAAPAPGAFEMAYRALAEEGADGIVAVMLSGALSATIQSAEQAARAVSDVVPVRVVDSRSITMGLGSIVVSAAEAAEEGADLDEVEALARDLASRTKVLGALDTLEYLKKGGRIGAARAALGGMLNVKPIIEIRDGAVEPAGRQRTRRRALDFLVGSAAEQKGVERLSVMHARCDDVDAFVQRLVPYAPGEIVVAEIGPVIGSHAGPGTIGFILQLAEAPASH
jgi:fatty acid kinase fatty acid binding subunit